VQRLAQFQAPIAALCIAALAVLELMPLPFVAPTWVVPVLLVTAGALGIARPSEAAKALAERARK
jgi:hypothetical protein